MAKLVERTGSENVWITPDKYVDPVRRYAPIGLDPCTEGHNPTGAEYYYTETDDGLVQDWDGYGLVYVNPPYSTFVASPDDATDEEKAEAKRAYVSELKDQGEALFGVKRSEVSSLIVLWAMKIRETVRKGTSLIALLPCGARFSTRYWQDCILNHQLDAACFVSGRIPFVNAEGVAVTGNLYDSIYYGFNVDVSRFASCFKPLGVVFSMKRQRANMLDGYV